jgi:hypothetical protein
VAAASCRSSRPVAGPDQPGKQVVLRLEPGEGNPRNSEGDFIRLRDGRILFVYTHFTSGAGDHASAYLAGRYSYDEGKRWTTKDSAFMANEGGMNIMSVSLQRLKSGEIALLYLRKNSTTDCIPYLRLSTDEAKTWGSPVRCIGDTGYYVVNNDRLVQLKSGRLIIPSARHDKPDWEHGKITCSYSDNKGRTWLKSAVVPNPENIVLQEPGVVELKDGRLLMFCRTGSGIQYFSWSSDRGESWSPVVPGNIRSPKSPASIERIPDTGDLLLVWNDTYTPGKDGGRRTPLNAAVSRNDGKTWEKVKTLEKDPDGWYCYTAIEFVGKHVLLGHCAGNRKVHNGLETTQVTRLSLDWIYGDGNE